jgi:hypothetical protein
MSRRHTKVLFSVTMPLLAVPLGIYYFSTPPQGLDGVLRDMGFYPVNPPSTLVGLGTLYHVSSDGRNYTTVCEVDPALFVGKIKTSPSTRYAAQQLQDASYKWDGRLASLVRTKLTSGVPPQGSSPQPRRAIALEHVA